MEGLITNVQLLPVNDFRCFSKLLQYSAVMEIKLELPSRKDSGIFSDERKKQLNLSPQFELQIRIVN